jgi:hypothetical protein
MKWITESAARGSKANSSPPHQPQRDPQNSRLNRMNTGDACGRLPRCSGASTSARGCRVPPPCGPLPRLPDQSPPLTEVTTHYKRRGTQILFISAYFLPFGGGTVGPRFLAPILVILALPAAFGISRFPLFAWFLVAISIVLNVVATAVDIVTMTSVNPLLEYYIPRFLQGKFSYNLGQALGLRGHASLVPLILGLSIGLIMVWRNLPGFARDEHHCPRNDESG